MNTQRVPKIRIILVGIRLRAKKGDAETQRGGGDKFGNSEHVTKTRETKTRNRKQKEKRKKHCT